jgi:hypothetical protein
MLKISKNMKEILRQQKSRPFLAKFLLLHYQMSAGYYQRALVDGIIRTQTGKAQRIRDGRIAWDILCDTTLQQ